MEKSGSEKQNYSIRVFSIVMLCFLIIGLIIVVVFYALTITDFNNCLSSESNFCPNAFCPVKSGCDNRPFLIDSSGTVVCKDF